MSNDLKDALSNFREITFNIIDMLKQEKYDEVELLFIKREQIIDEVSLLKYNKQEFKEICSEFNILNLQQDIEKLLNEKKLKVKKLMGEQLNKKVANKNYSNYFNRNSVFFSEKI